MKMIKDFRNNLMKRREVQFSIEAGSNPGVMKMQENCAHHFKVEADRVVIKKLWNNFGSNEFFAEAFVYDSLEDKNSIEPKPKIKKGGAAKEEAAKK